MIRTPYYVRSNVKGELQPAAQHPQKAAAMEAELERWFIDVTGI